MKPRSVTAAAGERFDRSFADVAVDVPSRLKAAEGLGFGTPSKFARFSGVPQMPSTRYSSRRLAVVELGILGTRIVLELFTSKTRDAPPVLADGARVHPAAGTVRSEGAVMERHTSSA